MQGSCDQLQGPSQETILWGFSFSGVGLSLEMVTFLFIFSF